jgi:uncharacterized membrane protein YesL
MTTQTTREFTSGPLNRLAQAVYAVLGPTACFLVVCLPFALAVRLAGGAVAIALAGILIGPAWTALLYATRAVRADPERGPVRSFWRGYRLNWRQTLAVWAPYWVLLVAACADVVNPLAPLWLRVVVAGAAAVSMLWMSTVLLVVAGYAFRTRDVLRLGGHLLFAAPRSTVAGAALLVVAGATVYAASELVLGLLAGVFALFALAGAKGGFAVLEARFTVGGTRESRG